MTIVWILILMVVIGLLLFVLKLKAQPGETSSPYQGAGPLFTPAERSFLGVLEQVLVSQFRVMGKVRLCDVIEVRKGLQKTAWRTAHNKIDRKHLDFVIVRQDDLSVAGVIELDDKSHARRDRVERDDFLNGALAVASIPFFRFPVKKSYSVEELKRALQSLCEPPVTAQVAVTIEEINQTDAVSRVEEIPKDVIAETVVVSSPVCEKCGAEMVKRKAGKGPHAGQLFWACSTFPKCRAVIPITG